MFDGVLSGVTTLSGITADDRPDPGEIDPAEHDRWLLDNRPPHHDTGW